MFSERGVSIMAKIQWESGSVPEGMEIRQVYGIILDRAGRVMLRVENKPDRTGSDILLAAEDRRRMMPGLRIHAAANCWKRSIRKLKSRSI